MLFVNRLQKQFAILRILPLRVGCYFPSRMRQSIPNPSNWIAPFNDCQSIKYKQKFKSFSLESLRQTPCKDSTLEEEAVTEMTEDSDNHDVEMEPLNSHPENGR